MRTVSQILALLLLSGGFALAQFGPQWSGENPPRNGACFYTRPNFRGLYFCVGAGDSYDQLPGHFRKKISSIRVRGLAAVDLYDAPGFNGNTVRLEQNVTDMGRMEAGGVSQHWNDRVLSLRVRYDPGRQRPARRNSVRTERPQHGACFFTEVNFQGNSFCLQSGETLEQVPASFDKAIVSVRVIGHAEVAIYDRPSLMGESTQLWSSVRDLQTRELAGDPYKNWSRRIASIDVR